MVRIVGFKVVGSRLVAEKQILVVAGRSTSPTAVLQGVIMVRSAVVPLPKFAVIVLLEVVDFGGEDLLGFDIRLYLASI